MIYEEKNNGTKNMCVDDTGGPHIDAVRLGGFLEPVSHISERHLNFVAPHLVVFYFFERGDYRVLL